MEEQNSNERRLYFFGEGGKLFSIYIVNLVLTLITLGLYYPWAKASILRYLYQETEFEGSRFVFHGTGREMFVGFIKAIGIFLVLYAVFMAAIFSNDATLIILGSLFFYGGIMALIPIAIHGAMKYRLSRSSWRGIHFGYRGNLKELIKIVLKGVFFSIITFGIYLAWMTMNIRRYVLGNARFGNVKFSYDGHGGEFFLLNLKGYFLSIFTLGIYFFWWTKDLFNYYIDNIQLEQDNRIITMKSTATGWGFFKLLVVNLLIIVFTLGLGSPWAMVRTFNYVWDNVVLEGELDVDAIAQTEAAYMDATGEDMADMLDLGMV